MYDWYYQHYILTFLLAVVIITCISAFFNNVFELIKLRMKHKHELKLRR